MKSKKWLFRSAIVLLAFVVLIALFYAEEDWRGAREWARVEKELRAKGERLTLDELLPPPVPDDQNVAAAPIFKELFPDNKEARIFKLKLKPLPGKNTPSSFTDLAAWQEALTGVHNEKTAAQDILKYLSQYDSLIEELRVALDRPYAQWPVNKKYPDATQYSQIFIALNSTMVLRLSAKAELKTGNSDKALQDLKLIFRFTDAIGFNGFLICHLVGMTADSLGVEALQAGLSSHSWSDAQLTEVQTLLHSKNPLQDYTRAFRLERGIFNQRIQLPLSELLKLTASLDETQRAAGVLSSLRPIGWTHFDQAYYSRAIQNYGVDAVDPLRKQVSTLCIHNANQSFENDSANLLITCTYHLFSKLSIPALNRIIIHTSRYQTLLSEADIACALERYRLKYHTLPDSLQALVPAYLDRVPHDVINGQPLIYKRVGKQDFILYSVGWNEKDDGGVVNKKHKDQGDWVWASKPGFYHTVE